MEFAAIQLSDIVSTALNEPTENNVNKLMDVYGASVRTAARKEIADSLQRLTYPSTLIVLTRLILENCSGSDYEKGIQLAEQLLAFLIGEGATHLNKELHLPVCASILNNLAMAYFQLGRWEKYESLLSHMAIQLPALKNEVKFWNAVAYLGQIYIRQNRIAEARQLAASIPITDYADAEQISLFLDILDKFDKKRFEIETHPLLREEVVEVFQRSIGECFNIMASLDTRIDEEAAAKINMDFQGLAQLRQQLNTLLEQLQSDMGFPEKYATISNGMRRWKADLQHWLAPNSSQDELTYHKISDILAELTDLQFGAQLNQERVPQLLASIEHALTWAQTAKDEHSRWLLKWGKSLLHLQTSQYAECESTMIQLIEEVREHTLNQKEARDKGNICSFFAGLGAKACEVFDKTNNTELLMIALETRKNRSLLANQNQQPHSDIRAFKTKNRLQAKAHYLSISVIAHQNRIQNILYTSDGSLQTSRVDIDLTALRKCLDRLDPTPWSLFSFGAQRPDITLTPLLRIVEEAYSDGIIEPGDHICVALDDPVNLLPIQYIPIEGKPAVQLVSFSRVTSFSDACQIADSTSYRPSKAKGIFVAAKEKDPKLKRQLFTQSIRALSGDNKAYKNISPSFLTAKELLSCLGKDEIIHIQAHGFFRPLSNPFENSGLVVSDGRGVPIRDGDVTRLLTPSMVNNECPNLSKSHVTLGACVSGQGLEGQGGDVLGLEMTLRLCGASSVLASHWNVNTEMMTTFCHHFYDNWVNKKMSRAGAWRKVILEDIPTIDVPILCGFSLFGDWR